jgi:hypothetical protein
LTLYGELNSPGEIAAVEQTLRGHQLALCERGKGGKEKRIKKASGWL